ncbi:MAG: DUF1080 domain-containing protein [Planctomycetes bacterium]|nr:DUF1080 domain-containing protein [Planctomycetota bacterium]
MRPLLLVLALLPAFACRTSTPSAEDGAGWRSLGLADFVNVNGDATTWTEHEGVIVCSGRPLGGARSLKRYTNFELAFEWRHREHAGNSGLFLWCPESAFDALPPGELPRSGIEVQVLDLGYESNWKTAHGAPSDWFTSHGDVFPVGAAHMTARTPKIDYVDEAGHAYTVGKADSPRSFPSRRLVRAAGEWNHYVVRAVDGAITLWVNGEEVNGATNCAPATGYLALESEGAPVEFRNLRVRELP